MILIRRLSPNRRAVTIKHDTTVTRHSLLLLMPRLFREESRAHVAKHKAQ